MRGSPLILPTPFFAAANTAFGRRAGIPPISSHATSHTSPDPKRVKGIEPSSLAWKAIALPLSYTRPLQMTNDEGLNDKVRLANLSGKTALSAFVLRHPLDIRH
jgi:hypothetical protein